ncbi:three-helix bundle dimerization domain-containing protein [Nocardia carnea]|uniref:three-helix bundle dimerization domain-containing protein n=1 Tax=Nocardia carnea TaxID=37328 RepID=UPI0024580E43|nr:hypothetical protein [Nocardia carnea]
MTGAQYVDDLEFVVDTTVDRLCREFGGRFPRPVVARIVRSCLVDLAGSPLGALPELGERSARQRLRNALASGAREGSIALAH